MAPSSLLEAVAALGLHGLVLASLLSASTMSTLLARDAWSIHATLFAERQVEQLIDAAIARAGAGPAGPQPVAEASGPSLVLHADTNGDGVVDPNSAERTELELRAGTGGTRVLFHRLGRQSMRIEEGLGGDAAFRVLDAGGNDAPAAQAAGITVPRANGTPLFAGLTPRAP